MNVSQLKEILGRKGISHSGKRKEELEGLVEAAERHGITDLEPDDHLESERKRRCVRVTGGRGESASVCLLGRTVRWSSDLSSLPVLRDGNIFGYLMHHCKWSRERLDSVERDDGYRMFLDGHVEGIQQGVIDGHSDHLYVEGRIKPEERQSAPRYNTWLLLSAHNNSIVSAGCQCVAA